jgi:acylphosphatase
MEPDEKHVRAELTVRGRVQGVYFRASAASEAQNLGLTGWVRNCSDGSVEAVAEGAKKKVEELIAWCRHGPRGARVESVEVKWSALKREFQDFHIRRY